MSQILLESFSAASGNYGLRNAQYIENFPFMDFQYLVIFNQVNGRQPIQLAWLIQSVNIGQPSWDVKEANHYNYRRLYKTRIQQSDTSMTMFDVADGKVMRLIDEYYRFYNIDASGQQFGLNFLIDNEESFFESIEIYQWQFPIANLTVLHRPRITSIGGQSLSAPGNVPVEISLTLKPEWIEYIPTVGAPFIPTSGNSDR